MADDVSARDEQAVFDREFRAALAAAIGGTGLCGVPFPPAAPSGEVFAVWRPGAVDGYVVRCGLEILGEGRASRTGRTMLNVTYLPAGSAPGQGECLTDRWLSGPVARDVTWLAAAVLSAVLAHTGQGRPE